MSSMRVRPIFWLLLLLCCASVLTLAALWPEEVPAVLQVRVAQQPPLRVGSAQLELRLTDPAGTPIDQAHILSTAWMPDMVMGPTPVQISAQGQGVYSVRIWFSMPGPWAIRVEAQAAGFLPQRQTLYLEVS
jgi:hypothetical protein